MKLKDKIIIITGGGRGIGRTMALEFAREGAKVVAVSRTARECEAVAGEIQSNGGMAIAQRCDVSQIEEVKRLIHGVVKGFGKVDVLVNNAGIYGPIGKLFEADLNHWKKALEINLFGTVLCTHQVLPYMIRNHAGSIINMSGGGAVSPFPHFSAYGTSKAAVVRFTETVSEEIKEFGVRINAIAPGPVNTRLLDEALDAGEKCGKEFYKKCLEQKEKGGTSPQKAAELAVFLASDDSRGLTGRVISAVWDDWRSIPEKIREFEESSMYTLRRIDGRNFAEVKK